MRHPNEILDEALNLYEPIAVIVLFSGGNDSVVTAHIAKRWAEDRGISIKAAAINTGLSADGWRQYCEAAAGAVGIPIEFYGPYKRGWYKQQVSEHGFPYSRSNHVIMYRMLKERVIRQITKAHKSDRRDNVLYATGIRRHESPERWDAPIHQKDGSSCYVSPIIDYTDAARDKYLIQNNLPRNPFNQFGLGSGDCQCNWGAFVSLDDLREHSPELYEKIKALDDEVYPLHGWHYGERPSKALIEAKKGQQIMPGLGVFLCAGCERLERAT